jgi:hypothetical protein
MEFTFLFTCVPGAKLFMQVWSVGAGAVTSERIRTDLVTGVLMFLSGDPMFCRLTPFFFFFVVPVVHFHRIHFRSLSFFPLSQSYFYSRWIDKRVLTRALFLVFCVQANITSSWMALI